MIGGNGYPPAGPPNHELFLKWLAANVFMPSLQFSFLPWDYINEVSMLAKYTKTFYLIATCSFQHEDIVTQARSLVQIHENYADKIIAAMNKVLVDGTPVNPPIWWIAPTDPIALSVGDGKFHTSFP